MHCQLTLPLIFQPKQHQNQLVHCCGEDCNKPNRTASFVFDQTGSTASEDYRFQPERFASSDLRRAVTTKLNSLRVNSDLYRKARDFQQKITRTWRGDPGPACILHGIISVLDETSKQGASALLIQFMVQARLIEKDASIGLYQLCKDWEQQNLALVGDGLMLDRIRQFFDDIKEITEGTVSSFKDAYRQSLVLNQALSRVVPAPGDLHTRSHQLDSIYRMFWGGFLQPICWKLGRKKVKGTDVTASYSQCHMLAELTYRCLYRISMDVYVHEAFNIDTVSRQSADSFAIDMAKGFHVFVENEVANSSDWVLRYVGQFLLRTSDYLLMCQSERLGDSILVEHCYSRFLSVFSFTGKRNYFELCCSQMEWHYLASANVLHQRVWINRMRQQKGGCNQDGKLTPNTALDLHLERTMPIYKAVKHRNSAESWVKISKFIPCSMKFTDAEMSRRMLLEFIEAEQAQKAGLLPPAGTGIADPTQANKSSTVPNVTQNLILITEGLVLAEGTTEDANRHIDNLHFWKAFDATVTNAKDTKRAEEALAG
jgi:hypothetical protein